MENGDAQTLEENQRENLPMLIARANVDIERQLRDSEVLDAKALGVLAADAAVIALLVADHRELNRLWWIVLVGLGVAALVLLWVVWPVKLDAGPRTDEFYKRFATAPPIEAQRQMLGELFAGFEANSGRLPAKSDRFKVGFALLVVSLIGAVVVALLS
jgi:hypothetical protein